MFPIFNLKTLVVVADPITSCLISYFSDKIIVYSLENSTDNQPELVQMKHHMFKNIS